MMTKQQMKWLVLSGVVALSACAGEEPGEEPAAPQELIVGADQQVKGGADGKSDASAVATFVDLSFEGSMLASSSYRPEAQIESQLLYTIGHLNGDNSVGRLDKLTLTDISTVREGDKVRIDYKASMLVAWGSKTNIPTRYDLILPRDLTPNAIDSFASKHGRNCVDFGASNITSGNMWYYYRPRASRCRIAEEEALRVSATLTVSEVNTTGKYPEYHKIWEDNALKVVAIYGKYEDNATSSSDAGISAYNSFVNAAKREFGSLDLKTEPAEIPSSPGVATPDITFSATLPDGRTVQIVALMVDNVRVANAQFDRRYNELSKDADFIIYNGHAGLGANIRSLASKGNWQPGQYSVVFMNGCDTYAYIDDALFDARARVNPDDPQGTKHLDIITNAMPSFFRDMSQATMTFITAFMNRDAPLTYEAIFQKIPRVQVILVSGEHDNVFVPGYDPNVTPDIEAWDGLKESGQVIKNQEVFFATPTLEAGEYVVEMTGTGDADLHVRVGDVPTTEIFDCRPYRTSSEETCLVTLNSPSSIVMMVRGWQSSSSFELVARRLP